MNQRLSEIDQKLLDGSAKMSGIVTLEEEINDSRTLEVKIQIPDKHSFEIISWKTVTHVSEEPDMTLHLITD